MSLSGGSRRTQILGRIALAFALVVAPNMTFGAPGESGQVKVVQMSLASNLGNYVFIRAGSSPITRAGCSSHATWHFVLALDTAWGKSTYALLLAAQASGKDVWLSGAETCPTGWDVESLRSLTVYD